MMLYLRERGPTPAPKPLWSYQGVGDYLGWVRQAFAICRRGGTVRTSWAGPALDLKAFRRDFMIALHRRINLKAGDDRERRWRRMDPQYQIDQARDAQRVNDYSARRVVHPMNRLSTPELQKRFGWSYTSIDGLSIKLTNPARPVRRAA